MKKHSRIIKAVLLALAVCMIIGGIWRSCQTFWLYEQVVERCGQHDHLLPPLRQATWGMAGWGCVAALGLAILLLILVELMGKSRREAARLRQKNKAMEQLTRNTQALAHHQRLETIGTLTASIAHEFNNLLTPIMGYSMMTLEQLSPEQEALSENVAEIYQASLKAKAIISRLSDLARKNTDNCVREVSIDGLIQKTLDVANPAKPENVALKLDLNCWDQRLRANEIQMSQMLLNLILNGFAAMEPEGGTLTVGTSFDGEHLHIRVEDTGCGIPEAVIGKIFDPFFTTKAQGKGTGLGLAIVAQMVENHKGTIRVDSREGEGTSFVVSLPRQ